MRTTGAKHEAYEEELLLALDEGLISQGEAGALREEALRLERSPLELLRERGRLSEDTLVLLRGELSREGTENGTDRHDRPTPNSSGPEEAATLPPVTPGAATPSPITPGTPSPSGGGAIADEPREPVFPVPGWDRYQPVRFLGQGGMGLVFLAYDPLLRRNVALKFVRGGDPELARRFLAEARAQARVRHERVCEVYEVGEVQGRGFIAMRYVDGQPLGQLAGSLTLEQKVLVLRQAAEGVHAAHRAGFVHRDIKPANILVERTEDGGLAPFVMDFGLARDWRDEGTASGAVLGTPHYMAPEQARGEVSRLDRRVDVYALGASLYALLTGHPPFTGTNALEVITRLQSDEARPPRSLDKDIPSDLEAIVLKCLEKERSARYDSVRALIEDLERFLGGEPVLARQGLGYRLRKKARRHRVALSLGAGTLLVVTLALGQAVLARGEVAERERLSRRFTERVERIEASARYSALSRLHDTREDRKALRAEMDALEAEVRQAGPKAKGPGEYALGRALLTLGDLEGARTRLESAWELGYREPRVAWALALVLGNLYREQLLLEVERRSPEQREARRRALEQRYRDPALAYLRQAEGPDVPAPPLYVKALLAFYEGRLEEALTHLDTLGNTQPWFYEAPLLRGDVLLARATQRWNQGDRPGSQADLTASHQAYAATISTAESVPDVHYALGRLELAALVMELYGQGDVLPHYQRGLESLSRALTAAPDHYRSQVLEARFHRRLAEQRTNQGGKDVEPLLEKAIASARAAQALAPPSARVPLELAVTWRLWARYRQQQGLDPREQLRQSIESFEHLRPEDRDYSFFANLGVTHRVWADYEGEHGGDPLPHLDRAVDAYLAAIHLDERQADAWINLGSAYRERASNPRAPDAAGDLERARDALDRALTLNPSNILACFNGADVSNQLAHRRRDRGEDFGPDLEKALALYRKGLAINPKQPQLHNGLGAVLLWQAEQLWEDGGDPEPSLAEAQKSFEQARELAPQHAYAYHNLGEVRLQRAVFQLARREDPGPDTRAAVELYRKALELLPGDADFWANLARMHDVQATWVLEQGGDPRPELARAEEALTHARELNPRLANAWRYLGEARGVRARWLARQDKAPDEDFEEAVKAFQQAMELEPRQLEYRLAAGHLRRAWAEWKQHRDADSVPVLKQGLELAEQVLATRPRWARARALRASVLQALADTNAPAEQRREWHNQAREDLEQALAHNPHLGPAWRNQLAALQQPVGGPPVP
ncbi:serine/threonine-protein kinase [Vitiosangium sp. GDMCC 1.1324]|uniref:serine/threonine-protein kinase n=1 Tax=Vitiosangium sp. (strain GDMCC 1.1324) TaxID=2138576 RepID=UPI000D3B8164|nr:serine/threonine-protein kinase [Vitiosangium sp. GDMCC 1.1324]PTL83446.1 serine/threonine protein kinase [Vitiosangium sp. GDMCC 1.1324]